MAEDAAELARFQRALERKKGAAAPTKKYGAAAASELSQTISAPDPSINLKSKHSPAVARKSPAPEVSSPTERAPATRSAGTGACKKCGKPAGEKFCPACYESSWNAFAGGESAADPSIGGKGRNSSRLESALDQVDDVVRTSQRTQSPARDAPVQHVTEQLAHTSIASPSSDAAAPSEGGGDTLERRRRERAAKRAAEAEVQRLEDEKAAASLERRRLEREARRKARDAEEAAGGAGGGGGDASAERRRQEREERRRQREAQGDN